MKRLLPVFLLLAAACADVTKLPPRERGKAAYASYNCRGCHRIGPDGGATGPDLTFVGFRKKEAFLDLWLKDPAAWAPRAMMPNFHFNDEARRALAAYLSSLKGEAYRQGTAPWDAAEFASDPVARGGEIFARAGCATCHGPRGAGGYPNNNVPGGAIPGLQSVAGSFTKEELFKKISQGVPRPQRADPAGPAPLLDMPAWGQVLKPDEIEALAEALLAWSRAMGGAGEEW